MGLEQGLETNSFRFTATVVILTAYMTGNFTSYHSFLYGHGHQTNVLIHQNRYITSWKRLHL